MGVKICPQGGGFEVKQEGGRMRMKGLVLVVVLLLVLLALGVACAAPLVASAQGEEPDGELGCPPCDASLEVEVLASCLTTDDEGNTVVSSTLRVRNTGEQGTSTATLKAFFTESGGSGTIKPDEITLQLEPGGEWTEIDFSVVVTTTRLDGSIQIRWEVTWESCRPYHNIGKGDTVEFQGCPTAIEGPSIFTAKSGQGFPWGPLIFTTIGMIIVSTVAWKYRLK